MRWVPVDLLKAVKERRSVRKWKTKPIEADKIKELQEAVRWAPSAGNLESRKFYFVSNKEKIEALCEATMRQFKPAMPLVVVGCVDYEAVTHYGNRGRELYCVMDVSAAVQNLLLAAHSLGLAGVWCGAFHEDVVREVLELPEHLRPVTVVPLGYPDEKPGAGKRKPLSETVVEVK